MLGVLVFAAIVGQPGSALGQASIESRVAAVRTSSAAGDHVGAIRLIDSLLTDFPDYPPFVRALALESARAGQADRATSALERLLRWDARYARSALRDSALAGFRGRPPFDRIDSLALVAGQPIARARVRAIIDDRELVPEGTAWDPKRRRVLLGSLTENKVVAIGPDGVARDLVRSRDHGLASVVGIHVDSLRSRLWVTSNARYDDSTDQTRSALYRFDVATGRFQARIAVPDRNRHFLNDLTTDPDGAVYITDTEAGLVWIARPGASALEPWAPAGRPTSPNGIAFADDADQVFVASIDGIDVVPRRGGARRRLIATDSTSVAEIDGLAYRAGELIAHQPMDEDWRLARYRLDPGHTRITGRELIESNTPDSRTSTTGEIAGDRYVFIGNGQIDRMNQRTIDFATMDPVRIYEVSLGPARPEIAAVALSGRDSVALLDAVTLRRLATVAVGRNPHEIAFGPDGRRAYVADAGATTISVLELEPRPRVTATWRLPDSIRVHDVEASADGRTVWAVSGERNVVLAFDANDGSVLRRFPLQKKGAWMIQSTRGRGPLVIGHLEGGAATIVDPVTGSMHVLPARTGEIEAAPSQDGREIWSINSNDNRVTVFDRASGRTVARFYSGFHPVRIRFTPDGRIALTVNSGDSTLVAFDRRRRERLASITLPADPKVIAVSADGRRAYVSHPSTGHLTLIDLAAMRVLRTVAVPGTPDGVALSPTTTASTR
jgi:DNA-binding beta-propeller fold protein YncE